MKLYEKENNKFNVYDYFTNYIDLVRFKAKEMQSIPEDQRIQEAKTYCDSSYGKVPLLEFYYTMLNDIILNSEQINYKSNNNNYHYLAGDKINNDLLDKYYSGSFDHLPILKIDENTIIRYYLLTQNHYSADVYDNNKKSMSGIIQLPKSLYLLQMLQQENFQKFIDESDEKLFKDIINLYSLRLVNEISFDELNKMDECGITKNAYDSTYEKASNDKHLLKSIKKYYYY